MTGNESVLFRSLVEKADRKFAKVRDLPAHGHDRCDAYFRKVFKVYTKLWRFQQENRATLVEAGLKRWEIGEIASRIGQLYYQQYLRTSETRFLLESFVFYEAILKREYFKGCCGNLDLALKELRFLARFLVVCLVLARVEMVQHLSYLLKARVEECRKRFEDRHFKEWKRVVQDIVRFLKADAAFMDARPLRHQEHVAPDLNFSHFSNFQLGKALKLQDALLTSYHPNEVKFTELTLDTFRMLQCLEWKPSESFFQMHFLESCENGISGDLTAAASRVTLVDDGLDSALPAGPRKAVLYRPSVTNLIAVIATICEQLPSDGIFLLYISAPGKVNQNPTSSPCVNSFRHEKVGRQAVNHFSMSGPVSQASLADCHRDNHAHSHPMNKTIEDTRDCLGGFLWLGPRGKGLNNLYPGDIIPFTRRPLFLIIDSDNSDAFKAIHGAERGEAAALLLSPGKSTFLASSEIDSTHDGSQFSFFLTSPLQAFCQLVGLCAASIDVDVYSKAENTFSSLLSQWETILCTCDSLHHVWVRVLGDPFLRQLILRFIFCRSVLSLFVLSHNNSQCLPTCLPRLPDRLSPSSAIIQSSIHRLANSLRVVTYFTFTNVVNRVPSGSTFELSEIQEVG
ncbi:unnamed protein product [Victoria cruziana]